MKKIALLITIGVLIVSCKNEQKTTTNKKNDVSTYTSIGMQINDADALSSARMLAHYKNMTIGDTVHAKMKGQIIEVCSKKGCWMTLDMGNEAQVMVRFKDYGFFMPLNAKGDVVINGLAFVEETPVEKLRHYAEDAGKSKADIAAITKPKRTYRFEADGVLLKK